MRTAYDQAFAGGRHQQWQLKVSPANDNEPPEPPPTLSLRLPGAHVVALLLAVAAPDGAICRVAA